MLLYKIVIEVAEAIDGKGDIAWDGVSSPEIYGSEQDIECVKDLVQAAKSGDLERIEDHESRIAAKLDAEEEA